MMMLRTPVVWCRRKSATVFAKTARRRLSQTTSPTAVEAKKRMELYDTLSQRLRAVDPVTTDEGKGLACYTCGPTTYAPT
jgi:hypothetical protein